MLILKKYFASNGPIKKQNKDVYEIYYTKNIKRNFSLEIVENLIGGRPVLNDLNISIFFFCLFVRLKRGGK